MGRVLYYLWVLYTILGYSPRINSISQRIEDSIISSTSHTVYNESSEHNYHLKC